MRTDYHSHILPKIDDGAKDVGMSMKMLEILKTQGIERVIATPHFYFHKQKSVSDFLRKRDNALKKIDSSPLEIVTGAEVAIEHGLSEVKDIEKLAITGTNLILLEFPYSHFAEWMIEEIHNVTYEHNLKPIIAHVHRYIPYYNKSDMEQILKIDAIFQVNNEALRIFKEKRLMKKLLKNDFPVVFGSDCHNLSSRKPNFDLLFKKIKENLLDESDFVFEKYSINK